MSLLRHHQLLMSGAAAPPLPSGIPEGAIQFVPSAFTITEINNATSTPVQNWNAGGIEITPTSPFASPTFAIQSTATLSEMFPTTPANLRLWAAFEWDVGTLMGNTAAIYAVDNVSSTNNTTYRTESLLVPSNPANWGGKVRFRMDQYRTSGAAPQVGPMRLLFFGYTL